MTSQTTESFWNAYASLSPDVRERAWRAALYASFCIAPVVAFVGGRPGMISAATGAMVLLTTTSE